MVKIAQWLILSARVLQPAANGSAFTPGIISFAALLNGGTPDRWFSSASSRLTLRKNKG
jgi:hypothetical protein